MCLTLCNIAGVLLEAIPAYPSQAIFTWLLLQAYLSMTALVNIYQNLISNLKMCSFCFLVILLLIICFLTPGLQCGSFCSIFSFLCNVLLLVVCPFVLFLFVIVLSVLRITASDYPDETILKRSLI
jgi:hypothetical protein